MRTIDQLKSLSGRVAVVTGGAGHLGTVFAEVFGELGASIAIVDIAADRLEQRSRELEEHFGVPVCSVVADVSDEAAVARACAHIEGRFGRVDVLVNNAAYPPGDLPPDGRSLEQQTLRQWQANLDVMLKGTFLVTRACRRFLALHHGSVINIASIYGLVGPDFRLYEGTDMGNSAYYAAAKGGIVQLTRYWATTLAPSVRVNCIAPGGIRRGQPESFHQQYNARTPLGRMGTEEDLKGALAFFASDLSSYVTGQVLAVDGGWTAW